MQNDQMKPQKVVVKKSLKNESVWFLSTSTVQIIYMYM